MKKTIIALGLIILGAAEISAGNSRKQLIEADLGPSIASGSSAAGTSIDLVTLAAPGAGKENCLEYAVFMATAAYTVYVLDGGTTDYTLVVPASTPHSLPLDEPLCASSNSIMVLRSSTTIGVTNMLNYKGFVGR